MTRLPPGHGPKGHLPPAAVNLRDTQCHRQAPAGALITNPSHNEHDLAGWGEAPLGFGNAVFMIGVLVFVVFLTSISLEYGQGTLRVLLARQPRRAELLTGKALALLAATAAAVAAAEALSMAAAIALAHLRGIDTTHWLSDAALSHAAAQYADALLSCACYGLLGLMLGVLVRSTPIALGIGLAWLLPAERILQNSWSEASHWLPGLVLGVVGSGRTAAVTYQAAAAVAIAYVAVAILAGGMTFSRRDVTA